jgi:hypothetical protein
LQLPGIDGAGSQVIGEEEDRYGLALLAEGVNYLEHEFKHFRRRRVDESTAYWGLGVSIPLGFRVVAMRGRGKANTVEIHNYLLRLAVPNPMSSRPIF